MENVLFWGVLPWQKLSNLSGQLYWDPSLWPSHRILETTDTKWALKTSCVSSDGKLLFMVLWSLVSVLIALYMEHLSALSPARSWKYFFLASLTRQLTRFRCCLYSTNFFCFLCLSLSSIACFISVFSHGESVWCFTCFFLRGTCLLIAWGNRSI